MAHFAERGGMLSSLETQINGCKAIPIGKSFNPV
jgi:hypothetical protein